MKPKISLLSFFWVGVLFFTLSVAASAQVTTADITGTVTDATGKVVAGATVTITNAGTGAARTVVTNESGEYTITELSPGMYSV
ncbi:MAG: carboxypeptidase-like regulatory domain-containing protein, partial [Acidobacteriota bacterium]|nr:carboxypeptidase-like regulatory domain-containing protein [Acidobacteriota bacterium]